jgi:Putative binding domain, N-terminal/Viral BACON domain
MKTRYCWLLVAIVVMLDVRAAQAQCTSSVTPTSVSVSSIGSTSALSVVSGTNCTWTAVSMVPWITVNSATGHGIGQVNYTVAANTTGVVRIGTMTVAGQTVTFTQAASSCTYSVTPTSVSVAAIGGPSALSVSSGTSCSWTAVSNVAWITITSGASGSGIGGVNYTVATNTGVARTGTLTVAGQTVTFSQAAGSGSGATPPPPPTNLRIVR